MSDVRCGRCVESQKVLHGLRGILTDMLAEFEHMAETLDAAVETIDEIEDGEE